MLVTCPMLFIFFFTPTTTTEIYTLSLHDALPISSPPYSMIRPAYMTAILSQFSETTAMYARSEEHTSELQSRFDLVCRLLLEKKNMLKQLDKLVQPMARILDAAREPITLALFAEL